MNERTEWKEYQSIYEDLKYHSCIEKKPLQPRERFERPTPGLQDECFNHWANEAQTLAFKIVKTKKQEKKKIKKEQKAQETWLKSLQWIIMNERTK